VAEPTTPQDAGIPAADDLEDLEGLEAGLEAVGRSAAVFGMPRAIFGLSGKDPVAMLNAVLTNDVPEEPGLGSYALLLNPKGRVQADLRVLKAPSGAPFDGRVLLVAEPEGAGAVREILGRYAPFSRVRLEDLSEGWSLLGLYGPGAEGLLGDPGLQEHESAVLEVGDAAVIASEVATPAAGYDLLGPSEVIEVARGHL
jgi:glycine cleavage system aminomethyltransferase T